jgi:hypothetical protein
LVASVGRDLKRARASFVDRGSTCRTCWLRETDGFEGFLLLAGEGKAIGLSFWASREVAERHRFARTQFRERILSIAGVRIEEVVDYEVVFARLGPGWESALGR